MAPSLQLHPAHARNDELGFIAQMTAAQGWVFASGGTYYRSTFLTSNDGKTFVRRNTPVGSGLRGHIVRSLDDVIVVGEYGRIAQSTDQGDTWNVCEQEISGCLYRIAEGLGALWIGGDSGLALRSEDGGKTWEQVRRGGGRLLSVVAREREIWFFGDQTLRFDGSDFEKIAVPQRAPLCSMAEAPDGALILVGDSGQGFRSVDGRTWETLTMPSVDIEEIAAVPDGMLAVGANGTILHSENGTAWETIETRSSLHFWCITPVGEGALLGAPHGEIKWLSPGVESWAVDDWDEDFD